MNNRCLYLLLLFCFTISCIGKKKFDSESVQTVLEIPPFFIQLQTDQYVGCIDKDINIPLSKMLDAQQGEIALYKTEEDFNNFIALTTFRTPNVNFDSVMVAVFVKNNSTETGPFRVVEIGSNFRYFKTEDTQQASSKEGKKPIAIVAIPHQMETLLQKEYKAQRDDNTD